MTGETFLQAAAALEKLPIAAQIKGVSYAGLRGVEIVKVPAYRFFTSPVSFSFSSCVYLYC